MSNCITSSKWIDWVFASELSSTFWCSKDKTLSETETAFTSFIVSWTESSFFRWLRVTCTECSTFVTGGASCVSIYDLSYSWTSFSFNTCTCSSSDLAIMSLSPACSSPFDLASTSYSLIILESYISCFRYFRFSSCSYSTIFCLTLFSSNSFLIIS